MGDPKGFMKTKRQTAGYRPVEERLRDHREVERPASDELIREQGSRCMDCGVPFCHDACPIGNVIPDWNDLLFKGQWAQAVRVLEASNNFPEFTGRVCPALCEAACVVGLSDDPITIRQNEIALVEWGFREGAIRPFLASRRTGKRVAVVGSGPAGMAAAQQLTRAGHEVVLFEADDKAGGILRYGIPDFKLEKWVIDRRLDLMKKEGLKIETGVRVGEDYPAERLLEEFDAACLAVGSRQPRDLPVEGRSLAGIHFAMDYLIQSNKAVSGAQISLQELISAKGRDVVVIGGGDTGADCVGTANRQGAKSVTQLEVLPKPPDCRTKDMPWPTFPKTLKTSTSHEEGCVRRWSVLTKRFSGQAGRVNALHGAEVVFAPSAQKGGRLEMKEVSGTEFEIKADLVILAMGFVHPVHAGLVQGLGVALTPQGTLAVDKDLMTSRPGLFCAGDASRGASLVVWAIHEGRLAAQAIDRYLMGSSDLP